MEIQACSPEGKENVGLVRNEVLCAQYGGRIKVVPKQNIRHLVRTKRFRKGVKVADIEKRALYVTT